MTYSQKNSRINFVDGLRGVAILLVIVYHAYARWEQVVPYGNSYAWLPPAKYGNLGVQLFFLISGFVILMTIERTSGFFEFIYKRWLRLFPAMLICSLILYFSSSFLPERPRGVANAVDLLPGLLFVHEKVLSLALGQEVRMLDGAFWSIFVEVQFYVFFGAVYFLRGRTAALWSLMAAYTFWAALVVATYFFPKMMIARQVLQFIGVNHYSWFLAGALSYVYFQQKQIKFAAAAIFSAAISIAQFVEFGAMAAALIVAALFFVPVMTPYFRKFLTSPFILLIGFVSYPLYLLHQNLTIAIVIKLSKQAEWIPSMLLPILPTLGLVALSWFVAARGEPALRRWISQQATVLERVARRNSVS